MNLFLRCCACFVFLLQVPAVGRADTPIYSEHIRASLQEIVARGDNFERESLWQQAADLYERAVKVFPDHADLKGRWQRAERKLSLSRRYHDRSFLDELLTLDEQGAQDLYGEVLSKILTHYVDSVDLAKLVELGYRNLDLAVSEPIFLESNTAAGKKIDSVKLRADLQKYSHTKIESIQDAMYEAETVGKIFKSNGFKSNVPIILEFLAAASEGLDPYSAHLSPNRLRDLYSMIDGNFVGLGVEVRGCSTGLFVVQVLPESPAEECGMYSGDVILEIDDVVLAGLNSEESANRLQGKAGSNVRLRVKSAPGISRHVTLARREVVVHSVTNHSVINRELGIGYVRINSFQKLTVKELEDAVNDLTKKGMRSLVMDLRGNPGGLLDVALQVANHFIDQGVLVSTKGRTWGQTWSHSARPLGVQWTMPVVVIVDGDSASASEIFAGAMKDHKRGTIVGTQTFGKGSVQSIFPLRTTKTGLRLTTAHFFSPTGKVFQGVGVTPDIVVSRPTSSLGEESPLSQAVDPIGDLQLRRACESLATTGIARR